MQSDRNRLYLADDRSCSCTDFIPYWARHLGEGGSTAAVGGSCKEYESCAAKKPASRKKSNATLGGITRPFDQVGRFFLSLFHAYHSGLNDLPAAAVSRSIQSLKASPA
jgi:hypothetical protein